jgi:hypothetical protein
MDNRAIEAAIKDCGLPGRLVESDGRIITIDVLNETSEKLERRELGTSEFCDLVLEWRARLLKRQTLPNTTLVKALTAEAEAKTAAA